MIVNLFLNVFVLILGALFSWLPTINTLPVIVGYDIDSALVTGVGQMRAFFTAFWPLSIMFSGFLVIMGYYGIKLVLSFFLGSRTPGH
jgi:hypothetical protein